LTLMTRRGCHLCEEMAGVVNDVLGDEEGVLEVVDIDTDPELSERYGMEIPVLLVNGRKAFKYRVDAGTLRRRLSGERRRQAGRRWWGRLRGGGGEPGS